MPFKDIVGKGENAGDQHFSPFPAMFSILPTLSKKKSSKLSANALKLVESKILSFCNERNPILYKHIIVAIHTNRPSKVALKYFPCCYFYFLSISAISCFVRANNYSHPQKWIFQISSQVFLMLLFFYSHDISNIYTPAFKKSGVYCFSSVWPSIHPFSQQPCIIATSNLV